MNILQDIEDFIQDAQHKIGELGTYINDNRGEINVESEIELQMELVATIKCLYVSRYTIKDGFNHLTWGDRYTLQLIHYYRERASLERVPYSNLINYNPIIVVSSSGDNNGGLDLPDGAGYIYQNAIGGLEIKDPNIFISNFNSIFP